ncbi:MAG TPA: hypothetical protein VKA67_13925, partial [Verrucomicrobiae bacterium]|nr:hypothetical protein [Verrucomicrobiae bacterium]
LWKDLGLTGPWSGKIYLVLHPAQSPDESITITSERFAFSWAYRVQLPDMVNRLRFLRALTQVLLLEIANRNEGTHLAEIPIWLREGLVQKWLTYEGPDLIPPPASRAVNGVKITTSLMEIKGYDPLKQAHAVLSTNAPIRFEELSWPDAADFKGERGEHYRCAAQLLVHQLLALPDGKADLRAMLKILPQYYNWQFAFLRAFHAHFDRLIDVEKWWAVNLVQFAGQDPTRGWPLAESLQKLNFVIHPPVQLRTSTNALPSHAEVSLQAVIRDWPPDEQTKMLQHVIVNLQFLRLQVAPAVTILADEYRSALDSYLKKLKRENSRFVRLLEVFTSHSALVRDAVQRLDELDTWRVSLQPQPPSVAAAKPQPLSVPAR